MSYNNLDDLKGLIGSSETVSLEFKSSRPFLDGAKSNGANEFINNQIAPAVSAMLNSGGGHIIIGIEEKKEEASELSVGIIRSKISNSQLQQKLIDAIQPAVADLVSVKPICVSNNNEIDKQYAFVISVKEGFTAYQASDKKYYARRNGQSVPMDDKDVRLRMLAGDKPRIRTITSHDLIRTSIATYVGSVRWHAQVFNDGIKTINRLFVQWSIEAEGFRKSDYLTFLVRPVGKVENIHFGEPPQIGLMPGMDYSIKLFEISTLLFNGADVDASARAKVGIFIDDGLPSYHQIDLMEVLSPLRRKNWNEPPGL